MALAREALSKPRFDLRKIRGGWRSERRRCHDSPDPAREPTPEERLEAAYQREQEAELAPTSIRASAASNSGSFSTVPAFVPTPSADADLSQSAGLSRAWGGSANKNQPAGEFARTSSEEEFDRQNMQSGRSSVCRFRVAPHLFPDTRSRRVGRFQPCSSRA